ncbi:hypothetical protein HY030_00095 [Candidatus Gottesmanbacteria bacterium]|nr:hypothetical protein [Candidatus Gottesmanbacteria bacterium]
MNYALKDLGKKVYEITVTVPWPEVEETYQEMLEETVRNAEISGFRKGKAPKELVEKNSNSKAFYEEVLGTLVRKTYPEIVKEKNLHPLVLSRIEILKNEEKSDWVYKITICEAPEVDLGTYKEEIGKLSAKDKIWVPGKDKEEPKEEDKNKKLSESLAKMLEVVKIELSDLIVEDEMSKLLSELLEEIKKLGLTLDQYLLSTKKTPETLKAQYREKALNSLKLEFALAKIADSENINVTPEELEKAIKDVEDEKLKEQLKKSSYQLASLLRRQKTLDFIAGL